jgi:hypothetical protein
MSAIMVKVGAWVNTVTVNTGTLATAGPRYKRPGGVDLYKRPSGTDLYIRP